MVVITKYDIGDTVWTMYDKTPAEAVIEHINVECGTEGEFIQYKLDVTGKIGSMWVKEVLVFSSKEELIKSL